MGHPTDAADEFIDPSARSERGPQDDKVGCHIYIDDSDRAGIL
ncbi:MAG: hypothetical protein WB660_14555 [Candidatus Sulfotelmatobacter sp.]